MNETLTPLQEVQLDVKCVWNLKRIDDELWCCHGTGITVYNFNLTKLRDMKVVKGREVYSATSLYSNVVVIATDEGLFTYSNGI